VVAGGSPEDLEVFDSLGRPLGPSGGGHDPSATGREDCWVLLRRSRHFSTRPRGFGRRLKGHSSYLGFLPSLRRADFD
jgi:hypothetical protein